MNTRGQHRLNEWILTIPSLMWLIIFFLIPTLVIFAFGFKPCNAHGDIGEGWSLSTFWKVFHPDFFMILGRTIWLSLLTAFISLGLALPFGYYMALAHQRVQRALLLLVVIPFWSSFLVRIFAWKLLLHPEGILKTVLVAMHIVGQETSLLYNSGTVLVVMVYSYLPFAILPIYAAASKFNFQLFEAAMDLGATRMTAFFQIFIPVMRPAIFTAFMMVLIPALGAYVIPDVVGGIESEMIGNKIAQRIFVERNLPQASLLSSWLALLVLVPIALVCWIQNRVESKELKARKGI